MPGINPLTLLEGDEGVLKVTDDGPDKNAQLPVPETGVLAASVVEVALHNAWLGPALATVGDAYTSTSVESVLPLQPEGEIAVIRYRTVAFTVELLISISLIVLVADATAFEELPVAVPEITAELHI